MAHYHIVQDDDLYFTIDPYTKRIEYAGEQALVLAKGDHNSEIFTFELPRIVEGHDMMLCDTIEVHYINLETEGSGKSFDMYKVTDLQIASNDPDKVMFTWLLSQNTTMYLGSLSFSIRFACTTGALIDYSWRTTVYSGMPVIESLDVSGVIAEQQSDVLRAWYMELLMAGTQGVNMVKAAEIEAVERIKKIDVIVEVEQETLDRIRQAGTTAVDNIRNVEVIRLTQEKEALIQELLNMIPVYEGEYDSLVNNIPVYAGETENV